jgi:hypothetical protein
LKGKNTGTMPGIFAKGGRGLAGNPPRCVSVGWGGVLRGLGIKVPPSLGEKVRSESPSSVLFRKTQIKIIPLISTLFF